MSQHSTLGTSERLTILDGLKIIEVAYGGLAAG
jgi:hypothetical protein